VLGQNEVPAAKAGTSRNQPIIAPTKELRSATLTVAVLVVFFFVLTLSAFFLRILAGLAALLAALLALSELTTLLTLFLHIVCHEIHPPGKAQVVPRSRNLSPFKNLVAAKNCKGWELLSAQIVKAFSLANGDLRGGTETRRASVYGIPPTPKALSP
jgi:hypothetical protein